MCEDEEDESKKCTYCGKQFFLNSCLKIHEVSHNKDVRNSSAEYRNCISDNKVNTWKGKLKDTLTSEHGIERSTDSRMTKKSNAYDFWIYKHRNNYGCNVCGKQFKIRGNLKTHMIHHAPKRVLSCEICKKRFSCIDYFKTHMRKHDTKINLQCPNCKKVFYNQDTFKRHISKGLKSEYSCVKRAACVDCKEVFLSEDLLLEHTNQSFFYCNICKESFHTCEAYKNHAKSHTLKCLECDRVFATEEELENHEVKCPVCQKSFQSHSILKRHLRSHLGKERHQCELCGKVCNKQSFVMHMRRHRGDTPYKCKECGAAFVIEHYLKKHMKTHSGQKDFRCETCGKGFNQKQNLKRHYRIHTGEEPFKCQHCLKTFKWSDMLMKHLKNCNNLVHVDLEIEHKKNCEEISLANQGKHIEKCEKTLMEDQVIVTCNEQLEEETLHMEEITLIVPKLEIKVGKMNQKNGIEEV